MNNTQMDCFDRMFLSTSFGHAMTFFKTWNKLCVLIVLSGTIQMSTHMFLWRYKKILIQILLLLEAKDHISILSSLPEIKFKGIL